MDRLSVPAAGEGAPQPTRNDQDALVVAAARQVGLALHVENAGFAHVCFGGDARRPAEGQLTDLVDRQGVDLTDHRTVHIDENGAIHVSLVDLLLAQVVAEALLGRGPDHVRGGHHRRAGTAGPVVGLLEQGHDGAEAQRELALVAGEDHSVLHHRRHGRRGKGLQPVLAADPRHETRILAHAGGGAHGLVVEIGPHPKQFVELGIVVLQHGERFPGAQEDDLDVQLHRCRPQGRGTAATPHPDPR